MIKVAGRLARASQMCIRDRIKYISVLTDQRTIRFLLFLMFGGKTAEMDRNII